uniref:hypothetical protein n=1 Tax=Sedimenticola hydrogenitrophicus TaxID=2967975 RepID=UPI0023AFFFAD
IKELVGAESALSWQIQVQFPSFQNASIVVVREVGSDSVKININNDADQLLSIKLIAAAHKYLRAYERTESTDKLLGDELAEFYRKREQGLLRLEELTQTLIDQNERYRQQLDQEKSEYNSQLAKEYEVREAERIAELEKRLEEVKSQEDALEALKSEIDDRQSRHARRQIRTDLKDALAKRGEQFSLTKSTIRKRIPIHVLFIVLIVVSGAFVANSFIKSFLVSDAGFSWYEVAKLSASAFALIASIIFYIRWNDSWFRRHADEEFRLKQLELDIDRASWVVEMALEWKEERGNEISPHLIEKLTENLFVQNAASEKATHPSEDLASAIINASSGLSLKIPGVGEVALDRRSIKNLKKKLDDADD